MGEILEFPSQRVQGLAYLERALRQLLLARGADEQLLEFATQQLTDLYQRLSEAEQYSFVIELPAALDEAECNRLYRQINEGLEGIRQENHALLVTMLAELVLARVRLFQLERSE